MSEALDSLDEAWAAWLDGHAEAAVRRCVAILESDASQDTAAALLVSVLAPDHDAAREAAATLVDVFVDRGDLPQAVAMAKVAGEGIERVAAAFGEGSARARDVAPAPPPLPPRAEDARETGEALVARALAVLAERTHAAGDDPVPELPLFSSLAPPALEALLDAFTLRELKTDEVVIAEGVDGTEAFVVVRGHLRAERAAAGGATVLAELGPGAIFGEMALVSGAPRAASVVANEPVQLLVGAVADLEALSAAHPAIGRELSAFCHARMLSNLIRHSQILGAVDAAEREALMARFEAVDFAAGDLLVEKDGEGAALYLIASGRVRVMGSDADGDTLVLAELGPGDVVGEMGLVLRRPASADVVATHDTVALRLTRDEFQATIREHPALLGELYDLASKRDEETHTVVAQEVLDVEDVVLL